MYIDTYRGSRLKTCDICNTEMLEVYEHNYVPAKGMCAYTPADRDKMCPICRNNYNTYGRRVIRKSHWAKYGINDKEA